MICLYHLLRMLSLKSFLQFLWAGKNPLKNIKIRCIILTSIYFVTPFEHLDQKSHVGSHMLTGTHPSCEVFWGQTLQEEDPLLQVLEAPKHIQLPGSCTCLIPDTGDNDCIPFSNICPCCKRTFFMVVR